VGKGERGREGKGKGDRKEGGEGMPQLCRGEALQLCCLPDLAGHQDSDLSY